MNNPMVYILLNKDLNMSPGKAAAQAAHAMASLDGYKGIDDFSSNTIRTVIVLEASNKQIENLEDYLFELDIPAASYIDEGANEVEAYSKTALAVGPMWSDEMDKRQIFKPFRLYRGNRTKKWWQRG
jgi:peptidyl-tRNA hydrolase